MQALVVDCGAFKYRDTEYKAQYQDFELCYPVLVTYFKKISSTFAKKEKRVAWTKTRPAIGSKIELEII